MKSIKMLFILLLNSFISLLHAHDAKFSVVDLRTEYATNPLGIDVSKPRFSWRMETKEKNYRQSAYLIEVSSEKGNAVWKSGIIKSGNSINIDYKGIPLQSRTRYHWRVIVWDQNKISSTAKSWFETGLMNPKISAWNNAKWIGGGSDDLVLYPQYLPVFKLSCTIQLDQLSNTMHAGLIFGANDQRLMDRNKNQFNLNSDKDSSYIKLELDISALQQENSAVIHVFRAGYKPGERTVQPLHTFKIPLSLINSTNAYQPHRLYISSVLGASKIYLDGEKEEHLIGQIGLNPLGQGGDFISYPVVADIGFAVRENETAQFSNLQISNYRSPSNTLYKGYEKPFMLKSSGKPTFHVINPAKNSMPMFRSTFMLQSGKIAKARLYITSRGIYDAYINGKRIGEDYFNPGLTQYTKSQMYQTFDVTKLMISGKNAIGVILGEGWWSGGSTYMGDFWNFFGDRQSFLSKLVITYANGHEKIIVSQPKTWKCFTKGPWIYGSMFQGEVYDATKEKLILNWSSSSYLDTAWNNVEEVPLKNTISLDAKNRMNGMPDVDDYQELSIISQLGETVRKVNRLRAKSMEEVRPGVFVYDMGQNLAGVPHIQLHGITSGTTIKLRYAEVKYPDAKQYEKHAGMIMLENIRAAMAQDIYITHGGEETIAPRFTYHGFRYIEITGIKKPLALSDVCADVLSSVHQINSSFETSNPLVNRLWQNIKWSMMANFMSIPTDCPQRNERLGWSGDISVFSRTATYLSNMPQFFRKHMLAMRDVQRADGRFADVAPLGGGFGDVLWGSAGITVAWESYQQYADKSMIEEHYPAMKNYVDFLLQQIDSKSNVLEEKNRNNWSSLGDWLSPQYDQTEKTLLWEAYLIYDLDKLTRMATVLQKYNDAARLQQLYNDRKSHFNKTYVEVGTGITRFNGKKIDTQSSYAVPLALGIIDEDKKELLARNLNNTVTRKNIGDDGKIYPEYSLMTGFIGTAWILKALSEGGNNGSAYLQLQQTAYPSWLYPVNQGATTIWERLNSYTHDQGFGGNNNMNSFNHYSFGAVGAWMYENVLGIQRDENNPGFKHFIVAPKPDPSGKMKSAKGHYESLYGQIAVSWSIANDRCNYSIQIPPNTTASVFIIATTADQFSSDPEDSPNEIMKYFIKKTNNCLQFELPSGNYSFTTIKKH
ncbi:family 78 glycoside hydrolase catalytic domain [Pedobacter sp. KACC 23697]|uniref:alpha-L-rhamnosidase n=1 Tax=Pedobacter sp. KACC 23697 TaxID=3149230 RepID=A0AAU7KA65_9SPHI